MTDNLKSAILSFALIHRKLPVEKAIQLSRLETEYQVSKWGKFSSHDADETQIRSRVAAALLFAYFHTDFSSQTVRSVK
jgi:chaperone required for assembly of F1-ATPase